MRFFFHRDHLLILLGAFVLLGLLRFLTFNVSFLNPVARALDAYSLSDLYFEIQHYGKEPAASDAIAIVDVTDCSDRGELALLLERITACEPACVGVDVIFEGLKADPAGNERLREAAGLTRDNTVFACKLIDYQSDSSCFTSAVRSFFAGEESVREGYVNLMNNLDNTPVRQFSLERKLGEETVPSFATAIVEHYSGHGLGYKKKDQLINYRAVSFPVVSPDDIEEQADLLEGRIVLVGAAREESDMHASPLGKIPGVRIQAHSVDSLLGKTLKTVPKSLIWVLAVILAYLFQVTVEAVVRATGKSRDRATSTFLRESRIMPGILLSTWSLLLTYIAYVLFVRGGLCVDISIVLVMFALTLESRKLYRSSILALAARHDNSFLRNSIYVH